MNVVGMGKVSQKILICQFMNDKINVNSLPFSEYCPIPGLKRHFGITAFLPKAPPHSEI